MALVYHLKYLKELLIEYTSETVEFHFTVEHFLTAQTTHFVSTLAFNEQEGHNQDSRIYKTDLPRVNRSI